MEMKSKSKFYISLFAAATLVFFGLFWFTSDAHLPYAELKPLGFLVTGLALLPFFIYVRNLYKNRGEALPFMPTIGIIFALYYGLPILTGQEVLFRGGPIESTYVRSALLSVVNGLLALLAGFYLVASRIYVKRVNRDVAVKRNRLVFVCVLLIASYSAYIILGRFGKGWAQIGHLILSFYEISLAVLALHYYNEKNRSRKILIGMLWYGVVSQYLISSLASGLLSTFIYSIFFIFLIIWVFARKFPWIVAIILLLATILLKGSIAEFRHQVWHSGAGRSMTVLERAKILVDITVERSREEGIKKAFFESTDVVSSRLSMISIFAHVKAMTPQYSEFWFGDSYATMLHALIPRFLWRDKPVKDLGQRFGHYYEFLDPEDLSTSINLPYLVEFYVNFGEAGVVWGMLLVGIFLRIAYKMLNFYGSPKGTVIFAMIAFRPMINIEGDFSLVFIDMLYRLMLIFLIITFMPGTFPKKNMSQTRLSATVQQA